MKIEDCITSHYSVMDREIDVRLDGKPLPASATWCSRHDRWISFCAYEWQERAKAAELQVIDLKKHLKYVSMIAERLGPLSSSVHREEALALLDGTLRDAREAIEKLEGA